jgi:hypothetical protein
VKEERYMDDPKMLEVAEWFWLCPRGFRKAHAADFMAWTYLFLWAGMFDD